MNDFAHLEPRHLSLWHYLNLPQREWPAALAQPYLNRMAETGFLLVPADADAVEHGDALYRQGRVPGATLTAAAYRQRHGRLHNELCSHGLSHLPVRMGPGPGELAALAWLVPAVSHGRATAPGLDEEWVLDAAARRRWLLAWAMRLCELAGAQRVLVQLPGVAQPACWFYRRYLGDLSLPGAPLERVRLLLEGLARYGAGAGQTPTDETGWPLLLNAPPTSWGAEQVRTDAHYELLPMGGYWH